MNLKQSLAGALVAVAVLAGAATWHWRHHIDAYLVLSQQTLPVQKERSVSGGQHPGSVDAVRIQCLELAIPKNSLLAVDVHSETAAAVLSLPEWSVMISAPMLNVAPVARLRYEALRSDGSGLSWFSRPREAKELADRLRLRSGVLAEFEHFSYTRDESSERLLEISDRYFQVSIDCLDGNKTTMVTGMATKRRISDDDIPFIDGIMADVHMQCECEQDLEAEVRLLGAEFPQTRITIDGEVIRRRSAEAQ